MDIATTLSERSIALDIAPVTARCVKCRMVDEDNFEIALAFYETVEFPGSSDGE